MKKISVVVPCYNEQDNVVQMGNELVNMFDTQLSQYDYEIIFIDNDSEDNTRALISAMCQKNDRIKAIFNVRNFGVFSAHYAILQTTGDCTIRVACDFQEPLYLIPEFVKEWENGYKIVIGIKTSSKENSLMYRIRGAYYKLVKKFSNVDYIEHFTGFGLYDKDFVEILKDLKDPTPFLRGLVAELGYRRKEIPFEQPKRRAGTSHYRLTSLYDMAMLSITSYTKVGLRLCTFFGIGCGIVSLLIGLVYLIMKLIWWNKFSAGTAPILLSLLFLGAVIMFFMGMIGEYILCINQRLMNRPLVVEEKRLNFEGTGKEKGDNN